MVSLAFHSRIIRHKVPDVKYDRDLYSTSIEIADRLEI
jgi:hypothetical protein